MVYVIYPHGGEHYLLTHWTYNEQTHLVLGRSPEAVLRVVDTRKFTKRDFPEVRTFERITIVQPSPEFQYQIQVQDSIREREVFRDFAVSLAREHRTLTGKLPAGFKPCPRFVPQYKDEDANVKDPDPEHYGCANCLSGVVVNRGVLMALYATASRGNQPEGSNWWKQGGPGHLQVRSRAPYADPALPLYRMMSNPRHHCEGTAEELATPEWGDWGRVMFFYHKQEDCPEWLARAKKSVLDRQEVFNRARDSEKARRDQRMSEEDRKRRANLTAFFGTGDRA